MASGGWLDAAASVLGVMSKSFLVLFFKKEHFLPFGAPLGDELHENGGFGTVGSSLILLAVMPAQWRSTRAIRIAS